MSEAVPNPIDVFVAHNRERIVALSRTRTRERAVPFPTELEIEEGVPLFVEHLIETLLQPLVSHRPQVAQLTPHAKELVERFTISQVVCGYVCICQVIAHLAAESISPKDNVLLDVCLDDLISEAITAHGTVRA
ncbi:MAG: hypothetical protein ABI175_18405 [Polyangiales bacterium]